MKNLKMMIVALMVTLVAVTSCAGNRIFSNLPKSDNLTVVYVSKAAMKMGMSIASKGDSEMGKIKNSIKNANGIEIVSADSPETAEYLKKITAEKMKEMKMELLVSTKEGNDNVNIYAGEEMSDGRVKDILIVTDEPGEYNVVYIMGEIDVDSITGMSK